MKRKRDQLIILLLSSVFLALAPVGAEAQNAKRESVTLEMKDVTLKQFFEKLQSRTDYSFLINADLAHSLPRISVTAKNEELGAVLGRVLTPLNCNYSIKGHVVTVFKNWQAVRQRTVSGIIQDESGEPLVGVSICIGESQVCAISDADGHYTLQVPSEPCRLKLSYVGMETEYINIAGGTGAVRRNIRMKSATNLQDVVVNGYYQVAKNSFTGAANTVTQEELQRGSNQNLLAMLKNVDPSFVMVENNSMGSNPNKVPDFQIRGTGSIPNMRDTYSGNPNMPVFIVDGFETTAEKVYDMDPYRVKSITLLKDAAATAIYGSRASNGVVVITTNAPSAGKLAVSYNADVTFYVPDLSAYNLCNAEQKLELEKLAKMYDIDAKSYYNMDRNNDKLFLDRAYSWRLQNVKEGVYTDWLSKPLDEVAVGSKHSVRLDGGTDNFRYAMDLNYNNTPGVMKKSGRERMGIGVELQYIYKNLNFRDQLTYSYVKSKNSPYGSFSDYAKLNPYLKYKNADGSYIYQLENIDDRNPGQYTYIYNPLYNATLNYKDESSYGDLTNNFSVDWQIIDGLRLKGSFSFTVQNTSSDVFKSGKHTDFADYTGDDYDRRGSYTASRGDVFNYDGSLVLSYFKTVGKHVINSNLGWNIQQDKTKVFTVKAEGFPDDNLDYISFATQYEKNGSPDGDEYTSRLVGFLGNLNYSYDERYLFDFSLREDASSRFGADKRWATFWSAGIGWNINHEKFFRDKVKWVDELKPRITYGLTGSQDYDPYQAMTTYQFLTGQRYYYGVGAVLMAMGNNNLSWQSTRQTNFGLDLAVLQNRLEMSFDYYIKKSKDVLTAVTLPPSLGFDSYMANLGEVENKGWEVSARLKVLEMPKQQLHLSLFGSMIHNKNKLLKISNALRAYNDAQDAATVATEGNGKTPVAGSNVPKVRFVEGASINSIWVNQSLGTDPLTGREIFQAVDCTTTTEWSAKNYVIGGCTDPDVEGTFGTVFSWRGWQLNATIRYRMGGQMYNQTLVDKVQDIDPRYNADLRAFTDRWQKPGDVSRFAAFVEGSNGINQNQSTKPTSRFVEDYNYLELSTLNIGYEFDTQLIHHLGLQRLKLMFYMNDVFHSSTVKVERGTDYPYARNFSFGLQARF